MREVFVRTLGLATPLGLDAASSCAEFRAGTMRFAETDVLDASGDPLRAARLSLIDPDLSRAERIALLVDAALSTVDELDEETPLMLGVPDGLDPADRSRVLDAVRSRCASLGATEGGVHTAGRASLFAALAQAVLEVASGDRESVVVGACDSLCDADTLAALRAEDRLLGPSPDGTLPGEAAGFFVVSSTEPDAPGARVLACASEREPCSLRSGEPPLGDGLSSAFKLLRTTDGIERSAHLYSAQSGEGFFAKELQVAYLRNAALMPEPFDYTVVASGTGDLGAAAGAMALALALSDAPRSDDSERGDQQLIYGCSDDGAIGACVVETLVTET